MTRLTKAQLAALEQLRRANLHRIRAGWAHGVGDRHVVAPGTADALIRLGLADKTRNGTELRIRREGIEKLRELQN